MEEWNFKIKSYAGYISVVLAVAYGMQLLNMLALGHLVEWLISYFIVFYMLTLYWDFKKIDILLARK